MKRRLLTLALISMAPLLFGFDPFQSSNTNVEEGNAKLGAGKYKEALEYYDKAAKELPDESGVQYNRGVALHRLGKFDRAREALSRATAASDRALKGKGFYNLGNTLFELKKYKEAADAFKTSLRLRSDHVPSKWNLELALRRIQEEEKKKDQDKKNKDQKDNKKDKNKDKQKQQDQKDKQDKQGQDKKQDQQKQQDKEQEQDQQKKKQERSDKDKERPQPQPREQDAVLDALERNDKNLQRQRLRGMMGGRRKTLKDW